MIDAFSTDRMGLVTTVVKLGEKTVLMTKAFGVSVFIAANFYPKVYVLLPASIVTGLGLALGVIAQKSYMGALGSEYSKLFDTDSNRIQARIATLAFVLYRMSFLIGNAFTSLILGIGIDGAANATRTSPDIRSGCGARYCNEVLYGSSDDVATTNNATMLDVTMSRPHMERPGEFQFYAFLAVGLACCLAAAVILVFCVQSLPELGIATHKDEKSTSPFQLLIGILRQYGDVEFLLLLPLMMSVTCNDLFWSADFTKAYVSCSIGAENNGYVSVWSSVSSIACCIFFGWFNTKRSRLPSLTIAAIVQLGTGLVLLHYEPDADSFVALCVVSGVWFLGTGIRQSLVPALVSVVFVKDLPVAFSNYLMMGSLSGLVIYALHNVWCMETKLYALLTLNLVAFVLYASFEVRHLILQKRTVQ